MDIIPVFLIRQIYLWTVYVQMKQNNGRRREVSITQPKKKKNCLTTKHRWDPLVQTPRVKHSVKQLREL